MTDKKIPVKNFWQNLPRPCVVLAPMADVTDGAFRRIIAKYSSHRRNDGTLGGSDVMWTEFVSADGLVRANPDGKRKLMADLIYDESERPIVAQLFSSDPGHMEYATSLCREMGFDGVDINMGCPDRSIEKQGCGSAMIKNPKQAKAVIRAAQHGAGSGKEGGIPVSVKTRLGYNQDELETWLPQLLEENPATLTLHARTRKELSKVPARWERVKYAVDIRNALHSDTLIIGNGDAISVADGLLKVEQSGADGVMLGRAIFGNPWLFHPEKDLSTVSIKELLTVMVEHTKLFSQLLPHKNFSVMKKHYKAYVSGFSGASELRLQLMACDGADEVESIVHSFLSANLYK